MNTLSPKLRTWIIAPIALLTSSGCDYIHLGYTDCHYYDGPSFDRIYLSRPVLNQEYAEHVHIIFDRSRYIDSYDYQLAFSGTLPPGITFYELNNSLVFEGTATSLGEYSFSIIVDARYHIRDRYHYSYYRDYCSYRAAQNYELIVEPI